MMLLFGIVQMNTMIPTLKYSDVFLKKLSLDSHFLIYSNLVFVFTVEGR